MGIDRTFIAYAVVVGLTLAGVIVLVPQFRVIGISPFFWILIAFALFEAAGYVRGRGAKGTVISAQTRFLGFIIALALVFFIPMLAGIKVNML